MKPDEVHTPVCRGGDGAVRTRITDAEGGLNGLLAHDRRVPKPDVARVKAVREVLIRDAPRPTVRPVAEGAA